MLVTRRSLQTYHMAHNNFKDTMLRRLAEAERGMAANMRGNISAPQDSVQVDGILRAKPLDISQVDSSGKLVRLDVVIMNLHLMVARVMFRSLAVEIRKKLRTLKIEVSRISGTAILEMTGKKVAGILITIADFIRMEFELTALRNKIAESVQNNGAYTLEQIAGGHMGNGKRERKRKTALVSTRHKHKPQRKANKSWRTVKPSKHT